jgi:ABC-type spermidine/putrescine transport system permease subunit II
MARACATAPTELEEAKQLLNEAVVLPLVIPDYFTGMGLAPAVSHATAV